MKKRRGRWRRGMKERERRVERDTETEIRERERERKETGGEKREEEE